MYSIGQNIKILQVISGELTCVFTGEIISINEDKIIIHSDNPYQKFKAVNYRLNQDKSTFLKNKGKEIIKSKLMIVKYDDVGDNTFHNLDIGDDIEKCEIENHNKIKNKKHIF